MATVRAAGVLDIGSNSVLLLVAAVDPEGQLAIVDRALVTTQLGAGLVDGGPLAAGARERTARAVAALVARARAAGAARLWGFATGAARRAADGAAFVGELAVASGVSIVVLTGEAEARLAYAAVAAGLGPGTAPVLVADVGGGTTELTLGIGTVVREAVSLPLGALRLTETALAGDPAPADAWDRLAVHVADVLAGAPVLAHARTAGATLAISGGTATALATVDLGLTVYDAARVHGHVLARAALEGLVVRLARQPIAAREGLGGLDSGRARILPAGALIALALVSALDVPGLRVSDHGVRHAYLVERLTAEGVALRAEGPWA
ncbi:MAG: Ppx/GppA family phosphatase [Candidatus Binatia bacterium]